MEDHSQPVDVICVCNADGELRPLRLRLENGDKQTLRVDIEQILQVDKNMCFGAESISFLCEATVFRRRHRFYMKYSIRSHTWSLLPDA